MIFNGHIFIEKNDKQILEVKNSIHPQFISNLTRWLVGDNLSTFENSMNWIIDRFYFYENVIDNQTDLSNTGIFIGNKVSTSFSSSNNILTVKMSYTSNNNYFISSVALANQYQYYSIADIRLFDNGDGVFRAVSSSNKKPIKIQQGETITFGWKLNFGNIISNTPNITSFMTNSIKQEIISLISTGYFYDNTGSSISSLSSSRYSSLRENGFIVAHMELNDGINNKMSRVGNPNVNGNDNSSIFFIDRTRKVSRTDNTIYFEQYFRNNFTQLDLKFQGFSLIKNPIMYNSILQNGEFEDTTPIFSRENASASFVANSSIYGTDSSLKVTTTAGTNGMIALYYSSSTQRTYGFTTTSMSAGFEMNCLIKADFPNIRSGVELMQESSPFTRFSSILNNNTPTTWTDYSATGLMISGATASKFALYGGTGVGEYVYYDKIRIRPYPFFDTTRNFGTQMFFFNTESSTPSNLVASQQAIKIVWEINLGTGTFNVRTANNNNPLDVPSTRESLKFGTE